MHISTDYVFAGDATRPYAESDATGPRTAYGRTKLAGEQAVLRQLPADGYVLRTAWLYGAHGPNFVRTMIRCERERPAVDVVDDRAGSPPGPPTSPAPSSPWCGRALRPGSTTRRVRGR